MCAAHEGFIRFAYLRARLDRYNTDMRFPETFIQHVLQATDIVELVGQYVSLSKKGREFAGVCPFHDDHKPSMYVSPAKQIYKCFACGAGGNAFQFVMNYEKLSFPEAVRELADRANIPLPKEYDPAPVGPGGMTKSDLTSVTEFAQRFFAAQLRTPDGAHALEYARGRGLGEKSIERFGLGYAPDSWDAMLSAGRKQGISAEQLVAAGLARQRDNSPGCYDYFRNRLMFPIHDLSGRVVAFGGRALSDEERAKYLNSPESVLFDKSSLLFGLAWARDPIVKRKQAVVVEGYLDVLLPIQAGVPNVVATLGTALTERHVRTLGRYAPEAVLIFDADQAGAAAAERALQLFLAQKLHVRVATIPTGKDPADFALSDGGDALQALIDASPDAMQYVWDLRYEVWRQAGGNPTERQRVIDDFLGLVATSAAYGAIDTVRQQNLAQHIAHILNIPAIDLQTRMKHLSRQARQVSGGGQAVQHGGGHIGLVSTNPERIVLEVLLDEPDLFDDVVERLDPSFFDDALLRTIAQKIWTLGEDGRFSLEAMLAAEDMTSLGGMLAELALAGQRRGNHTETLREAAERILTRHHDRELDDLKHKAMSDDETLRQLQQRLAQSRKQVNIRNRPRLQ